MITKYVLKKLPVICSLRHFKKEREKNETFFKFLKSANNLKNYQKR